MQRRGILLHKLQYKTISLNLATCRSVYLQLFVVSVTLAFSPLKNIEFGDMRESLATAPPQDWEMNLHPPIQTLDF